MRDCLQISLRIIEVHKGPGNNRFTSQKMQVRDNLPSGLHDSTMKRKPIARALMFCAGDVFNLVGFFEKSLTVILARTGG